MNWSRRAWLFSGAFLPVALQSASSHSDIRIGCQTDAWPIRPSAPETFYQTIEAIRTIGFQGFETGFRNVLPLVQSASEFRQKTKGLTFFGVHIFLNDYDPETHIAPSSLVTEVIDAGKQLGANRLIVSGAPCASSDVASKKAEALNRYGQVAKAKGLGLAYHNHGPEFSGASHEIDFLLAHTDPQTVSFVLDAGHAFRAGGDVAAFVAKYSKRLAGVHLRDFSNGKQVPLGAGDFPLHAVISALRSANWSGWVLAEEEREDGSKLGNAVATPAFKAIQLSLNAKG